MLSVIIPTRNRADSLQLTLQSLLSQTLPRNLFEVLVIDNGSTDKTKNVVQSFQQKLGNVQYFFEPSPGLHVGRHLGMKNARSEILVYADDDVEAFPTWLEAIVESFQDQDVALVGGKNLPKFEAEPPNWILKMWEKDQNGDRSLWYLSIIDLGDETKKINPYFVFGCNFSIRKSILLKAGGFHPDSMPQELIKYRGDGESHVSHYILEHGYKTIYHPKASVYHLVPASRMTEEYFCQRAYNQGISDSFTNMRQEKIVKNYLQFDWKLPLRKIKQILVLNKDQKRRLRIQVAYRKGYKSHQKQVKNDDKIQEWVLRDNYLGNKGSLPG
jgi:glycosyltransferase involved in cell wall biosynthesis